jgi:glycosyltransferase involved in cell wall biosynthesis
MHNGEAHLTPATRRALLAHRLALRIARPLLRSRARPATAELSVTILMTGAYGGSGVPRATFALAEELGGPDRDVEIVNLVRRRPRPVHRFPPGVRITTLDDNQTRMTSQSRRALRFVLRRFRGRLLHPDDVLAKTTTLWTDTLLIRRLRTIRSGVVIATRPSLTLLAAELARPGVTAIGWEHRDFTRRVPSLRDAMWDSYARLDGLVVQTETDRRRYRGFLAAPPRIAVIPNSVPEVGRGRAPLTEPVVIAAGRLTGQKGFDRLIRAFTPVARAHPQWSLRICGEGPRREGLEAMVARRHLEHAIELSGHVADIAAALRDASIFALSSRSEGFPLVLIEAMACGLPVVSFDCDTGPADIVEHGHSGLLVPQGDVGAFTDALLELIRDPDKRRRFGAAGARRAERWDADSVSRLWDQLLREVHRGMLSSSRPSEKCAASS